MNRITNLQEIKSELQKVESAVEKALASGRMCDIERDIVMERLRAVYNAIQYVSLEVSIDKGLNVMSAYLPEVEAESLKEEAPDGVESETVVLVEKEVEITLEEMVGIQPPIARDIIDSLYGDAPIRKEPEAKKEKSVEKKEETQDKKEVQASVQDNWVKPSETKPLLNETMGDGHPKDVASMLSSQAVSDLRKAIGLNDRFLLLTDLFNQDAEVYERTLDELDKMANIENAYIFLYEHFTMDDSKEGVKRLIELLEAKFS